MGQDIVMLTRSVLVNATMGTNMLPGSKSSPSNTGTNTDIALNARVDGSYNTLPSTIVDAEERDDHPRMRFWIRRSCDAVSLLYLLPIILGIIAGIDYKDAINTGKNAALVQQLRYVAATSISTAHAS